MADKITKGGSRVEVWTSGPEVLLAVTNGAKPKREWVSLTDKEALDVAGLLVAAATGGGIVECMDAVAKLAKPG